MSHEYAFNIALYKHAFLNSCGRNSCHRSEGARIDKLLAADVNKIRNINETRLPRHWVGDAIFCFLYLSRKEVGGIFTVDGVQASTITSFMRLSFLSKSDTCLRVILRLIVLRIVDWDPINSASLLQTFRCYVGRVCWLWWEVWMHSSGIQWSPFAPDIQTGYTHRPLFSLTWVISLKLGPHHSGRQS